MNVELLWTFIGFALVASITPGPNNFMVMASAGAFGWRRTVPHVMGIAIGFAAMLGTVALGLGAVLIQFPSLLVIVKTCGAVWLFWLAWQFAAPTFRTQTAASPKAQEAGAQPMRFHQAALFQLVNPKTWTILIAVTAAYSELADDVFARTAIMIAVFMIVAPLSNSAWVFAGEALRKLLGTGASARWFSRIMALLITVSALMILLS
ncbi:LysE family translocator [uncultured Roseobacter sp.]|uniref:LysE family translocator n=1 Tax=uncultured Roseobacter sp. TaxID=114847 RepID=UPI0026088399|nr:LysE family translocator [uncultured Roseobacter sp.]